MSQSQLAPLHRSLVTSLGLTLDYLTTHAHLRELFTIHALLARHAADVAGQQSQQASVVLPQDDQELPAVLRDHVAEIERHQHALQDQYALRIMQGSPYVAEP